MHACRRPYTAGTRARPAGKTRTRLKKRARYVARSKEQQSITRRSRTVSALHARDTPIRLAAYPLANQRYLAQPKSEPSFAFTHDFSFGFGLARVCARLRSAPLGSTRRRLARLRSSPLVTACLRLRALLEFPREPADAKSTYYPYPP